MYFSFFCNVFFFPFFRFIFFFFLSLVGICWYTANPDEQILWHHFCWVWVGSGCVYVWHSIGRTEKIFRKDNYYATVVSMQPKMNKENQEFHDNVLIYMWSTVGSANLPSISRYVSPECKLFSPSGEFPFWDIFLSHDLPRYLYGQMPMAK